jgi:serine/threonine-protein kinase RsbT
MAAEETLSTQTLRLATEDDVMIVRRLAKEVATHRKFDTFAIAALTTAASELARNVIVHGRGGEAIIEEVSDGHRFGVRMTFRDNGPGITNIERVLRGGYSTAKSMGLGLSGSKRLVDAFEIESTPDVGTRVIVTKWKRF